MQYFVSMCHVYSEYLWYFHVDIYCSILYKEDGLQVNICVRYSWEMALNMSLDNMWDWKGLWETAGEVNSMEAYITNDNTSC
jgi:hypothetical protein